MLRSTLFTAMLAAFCGCGSPPVADRGEWALHGGVFNFNETQVLRSIFPLTITRVSEQRVASQIYEGLVRFNAKDLSVVPCLAKSWDVDPTGTIYTFHLRDDVRFQDDPIFSDGEGRELTAEDVVHCFTTICQKGACDRVGPC